MDGDTIGQAVRFVKSKGMMADHMRSHRGRLQIADCRLNHAHSIREGKPCHLVTLSARPAPCGCALRPALYVLRFAFCVLRFAPASLRAFYCDRRLCYTSATV